MDMREIDSVDYEYAKKRVEKIKGFYVHLIVYVVINAMLFAVNKNFGTALWWGLGLVIHAVNVFLFEGFLGKEWEERKINEIMERDKDKDFNEYV
jgi:hypothetical protein